MRTPGCVVTVLLCGLVQSASIDGTWELTRIFRAGSSAATRAVPIDSTVYVRLTLKTMPGEWIDGHLYRRYYGKEERTKIEAGPLRGTGRYIISADLDYPASQKARTAGWLVGDRLRLGTPFVPDADSLELTRVRPDAPLPASVVEVVTAR
jgi:hypothetical protein